MQAIETKYISPTNHRGSRIKATCQAGTVTVPYDDGLSASQAHAVAAQALAKRFGWAGRWIAGEVASNPRGYTFVNATWADRADQEFTITEA